MVQIWAVAKQTLKDALRKKLSIILLIFAFALILTSQLFPAFGPWGRYKMIVTVSMSAMSLFGVVVAIFLSATAIPSDIEEKRIYTVATKPISRAKLVTGRIFGFILVCAVVLVSMGIVADICVRIAPGELVVIPKKDMTLIYAVDEPEKVLYHARADEEFVVRGEKTEKGVAGYIVALPGIVRAGSGFVSKEDMNGPFRRRVRTQPILEATEIIKYGRGTVQESAEKALLYCEGPLGKEEWWSFDVGEWKERRRVRLACASILWKPEPLPGYVSEELRKKKQVVHAEILLVNEASGAERTEAIDFVKIWTPRQYYRAEDWLELGPELTKGGRLKFKVLEFRPEYRRSGTEWIPSKKGVIWKYKASALKGLLGKYIKAQLNLRCIGPGMVSREKMVELGVVVRRPSDGRTLEVSIPVKDRTISTFRFPKEMIGEDGRLEIELKKIPGGYTMGIKPDEASVYLLRTPLPIEVGLSKAVLLLLLALIMVVVITVMASTFLSAPVAILVGIFFFFCANIVDFMRDYASQRFEAGGHIHLHEGESATVLEVSKTIQHFLKAFARGFSTVVPDFSEFSATKFLLVRLDVPAKHLWRAFLYAGLYILGGYLVSLLIFHRREFL